MLEWFSMWSEWFLSFILFKKYCHAFLKYLCLALAIATRFPSCLFSFVFPIFLIVRYIDCNFILYFFLFLKTVELVSWKIFNFIWAKRDIIEILFLTFHACHMRSLFTLMRFYGCRLKCTPTQKHLILWVSQILFPFLCCRSYRNLLLAQFQVIIVISEHWSL